MTKKYKKEKWFSKWRGFTALLITLSILCVNPVFAQIDTNIQVNGKNLVTDVAPVIMNDYTYVPIRNIGEILGYNVNYDEATESITMFQPDLKTTVKMTVNSNEAYVNNQEMSMPVPPVIINSRTLVPVRFVSEALESKVKWIEGYEYDNVMEPNLVKIYSSCPVKYQNTDIYSACYSDSKNLAGGITPEGCTISYDIVIPQFSNMKDSAFQQTLNDEFKKDYEETKTEMDQNYQEQQAEEADYRYMNSIEQSYYLINETSNILSLMVEGYSYSGGAHGMPYRRGVNIDFEHSKLLKLSDLFKSDTDYNQKLLQEINKIRLASPEEYDYVVEATQLPSDDSFYFQNGKLVIFYHPYDLSSYARGFVNFEIPLENLADYLKDEYRIVQ